MAKNDMRWRRTERNIMAALGAALRERPLDKISVTSLAREADINKATFYLHYHDIYDAASAYARACADVLVGRLGRMEGFFDTPRMFAVRFVEELEAYHDELDPVMRNRLTPTFVEQLTQTISARLFELHGTRPDDRTEYILLTFIVGGFIASVARFAESDREKLLEVCGDLLQGIQEYGQRHFGPLGTVDRV